MPLDEVGGEIAAVLEEDSSPRGWMSGWRRFLLNPQEGLTTEVRLFDRPLRVQLTRQAVAAANALQGPLTVEAELYFSCMIRKAVRFRHTNPDQTLPTGSHASLLKNLSLQFRPVTTQHCQIEVGAGVPPLETMPVTRPQAFVPRWVSIDFHHGDWLGEFGY